MNKVMIVDDSSAARESLKRLKIWGLELGFSITDEAENGHEALEKLKIEQVDLVITDIRMPKINGIELLKKIKEYELVPFVILISDYGDFGYAKDGFKYGAYDYLLKPVQEGELREALVKIGDLLFQRKVEIEEKKMLEQKYEESTIYYFSKVYVNSIVSALCRSKSEVMAQIELLMHFIDQEYDDDKIKLVCILQRIYQEIGMEAFQKFSWLKVFICKKDQNQLQLQYSSSIDFMKEEFCNAILGLNETIMKYEPAKDDSTIMKICEFVLENIENEMSTDIITKSLFFDKPYLCKLFRKKTNMTLTEYITMVKMEQARNLISEHDWNVSDIAEKLGYKDKDYFSKVFKRYTGCSVQNFRKMQS